MAPIQRCCDVKISAPGANFCRCGGSSKRSWDTFLPITRRGSFFQDSFFSNIHHDFDAAVREVLNRWSDSDLTVADRRDDSDIMGRYRQLRSRDMKEENQAITVSSDNASHKIVLDMNDFMSGDVKVKVVGEKELVVEGRVEKEEGSSSVSARSFRRRFSLPHLVDMAAITSVMSSDGILTITVPKIEEEAQQKTTVIPVKIEKNQNTSTFQNSESSNTSFGASVEASSVQGKSVNAEQEECECARCSLENECKAQETKIPVSNASRSRTEEGFSATEERKSSHVQEGTNSASYGSWDTFLPITRRGNFFHDSFFSDIHQDFNSAIREVLKRWNDSDLKLTDRLDDTDFHCSDVLDHYRKLRSRNLKEENQAITVSSGNSSHKIVLDVQDFMGGDVKVKVLDEKELLVEGRVEKKEEGSLSLSSHSFRRRFTLPQDTDMTAITSVMSSDGILTITAPTMNGKVQQTKTIPVTVEGKRAVSQEQTSSSSTKASTSKERTSAKEEKQEEECQCHRCSESQTFEEKNSQKQTGMKIPIKIIGSTTNDSEKVQSSSTDTYASSQKNINQNQMQEERQIKVETTASKESSVGTSTYCNSERQSSEKRECESVDKSSRMETTTHDESGHMFVPIRRRGLFFNDSVFQDTRNDFHKAIKEVLRNWGEESSIFDDLTCYRNLRSQDLREENQAVTSVEDESYHKFVIDVQDFMDGGEISVKAVNDRELVVEGHMEKKENGSKSTKRFLRRFVVPGDIHLEAVTSVMSSDGVLTISAPKKKPTIAIKEVNIPMSIKEREHKSQTETKDEIMNSGEGSTKASTRLNVKIENQRKCDAQNLEETSTNTSSRSSFVDSTSVSSSESQTRKHTIPVHYEVANENNNLEQLDQQHQVTMKGNQVFDDTRKSESETEVSKVSLASERKCTSESTYLPIIRKGLFSDDHFFENVRQNYSQAVKEVLESANEWCCEKDFMQTYRNLRQRNLQVENQAFSVTEDGHTHKVVMDVHDFTSGDVTVSLAGGNELVIEGQAEKQEGSCSARKSFCRRFLLPELIERDAISSALSSDGILTVISTKRGKSDEHKASTKGFSSEMKSRVENQTDNGHSWEEKKLAESSKESDGYSVRTFASSSRAQHHQSYTNHF
ncbi:uncharacterized protein LOC122267835 [Penaeus japonicus]|uniref:uncharacterized protein LOC122267835 n=1 Tax=Penaeus japonicus TaxID=27405 RepID=UPI001C710C5D|nr:uncharacterized protein LOC122267835 [Penaeus japonicus]